MSGLERAKSRAMAGTMQEFGVTPQDALSALMRRLPSDAPPPIVIWPYNHGDNFFTNAQQARLEQLKARRESLTADERAEMEGLIAAAA